MMKTRRGNIAQKPERRKGAVIVLAAVMLMVVIGFVAFTVDIGMIALTKGQIQNAADSAAHAATLELSQSFGPGAQVTAQTAESVARSRAVEMVSRFRTGDVASTEADEVRDVRVGRRSWNASTGTWDETWGVPPFNMAEVTVRRTQADTTALPMAFAQIMGMANFELTVSSVSSLQPAGGFYLPPGSPPNDTIDILPIALDLGSWNNLLNQVYGTSSGSGGGNGNTGGATNFTDSYSWNAAEGVKSGADGVLEINIYPDLNSGLAPGNRGTVDLGHPGNSTADLKRQIEFGLNAYDLSFFPDNRIMFNNGALYLNGDTGISAGIQSSLEAIIGKVRAIPIFIEVTGQGNNATYTVVKFVGVRVMGVKLSGGPKVRHLTVQPALFSDSHVVRMNGNVNVDSILSPPVTIR
ncbi:MAG: pilus assembly protein TadG-related protein [Planctomycetaceae bacterium]